GKFSTLPPGTPPPAPLNGSPGSAKLPLHSGSVGNSAVFGMPKLPNTPPPTTPPQIPRVPPPTPPGGAVVPGLVKSASGPIPTAPGVQRNPFPPNGGVSMPSTPPMGTPPVPLAKQASPGAIKVFNATPPPQPFGQT